MIRTISPQDMREMERAFLEGTGYPSILLMEHAAQAVVAGGQRHRLARRLGQARLGRGAQDGVRRLAGRRLHDHDGRQLGQRGAATQPQEQEQPEWSPGSFSDDVHSAFPLPTTKREYALRKTWAATTTPAGATTLSP